MHIRRLAEDDAEAFRTLRLRALRESPEAFGSSYEETVGQSTASMAQRMRPDPAAPHNFVLGAFDPGLIGMIGFYREPRAKTRHKGAIWGMFVACEARGRGIGRALLETVIVEARQIPGLEQIVLLVVAGNQAASGLYLSCGFAVYGVEPRALRVGDQYYDEELMVLRL
jgi:RimJ/RimL family protein N-acetyltransferase